MKLADFGQIKTRLPICGTVLVGGTVFGSTIAGIPGIAAILATSGGAGFVGLAGNLLTGIFGNDLGALAERLGRNDEILKNHDLAQAVGRAIAAVIASVAKTNQFPAHKDILSRLAKTAAEDWVDELQELR